MASKRIYYAASYRGRTYWTAAKRLVGWNVLLLLHERLGIKITTVVRLRVDKLNAEREKSKQRQASADCSKRRAQLKCDARRENTVRKNITATAGYRDEGYRVGANKRSYSLEDLEDLRAAQEAGKKRIDALKTQEELADEVGDRLRFSWGWRCVCGHITKGTQAKSKVRAHSRSAKHLAWAWAEELTDLVCKCSQCGVLVHADDAESHAITHREDVVLSSMQDYVFILYSEATVYSSYDVVAWARL